MTSTDFVCVRLDACPSCQASCEMQSCRGETFALGGFDFCLVMICADGCSSCPCFRVDFDYGSSVACHLDCVCLSGTGSETDHFSSSRGLVSPHLDPPIASASSQVVGSHRRAHLGASGGHDRSFCKHPSPQTAGPRQLVGCDFVWCHVGDVGHVQDSVSNHTSHRGRAGRAQTTKSWATYRPSKQ